MERCDDCTGEEVAMIQQDMNLWSSLSLSVGTRDFLYMGDR